MTRFNPLKRFSSCFLRVVAVWSFNAQRLFDPLEKQPGRAVVCYGHTKTYLKNNNKKTRHWVSHKPTPDCIVDANDRVVFKQFSNQYEYLK